MPIVVMPVRAVWPAAEYAGRKKYSDEDKQGQFAQCAHGFLFPYRVKIITKGIIFWGFQGFMC